MKYISKTRKSLVHLKEKANGGMNSFALVFKEGKDKVRIGRVCYSNLNYEDNTYSKGKGPISFLSIIRPLQSSLQVDKKVVALDFLTWLFNDSAWSSVFYTKSASRALREGMICHTDVTSSLLLSGLSVAREVNEVPGKVVLWGELVRLGMDKTHAYVASYMIESTGKDEFSVKKPMYNSNHLSLSFPLSAKYIKKFCSGVPVLDCKRNIFRENTNFSGIFALWGINRYDDAYSWKFSKKETKTVTPGWGREAYHNSYVVYKTEADKRQFVDEFTAQIKEICNG